MELANIEKLVQKYLNAETSLQEEASLKDYFTAGNVAPHLQEYESMFNYFATAKKDTFTKNIQLSQRKPTKKNFKWLSIAASFMLLLSVYVGKNEYERYQAKKQFMQVTKGLKLLSYNLKKGEQALATLYTYENTVKKILK
ncbi:hypothetical protein [uncultured Polaribacter sp.]|uniref:hypothetical protein n=1 Tax=uncultured Polaribacter sp. TaxID=174711 RepID=UPI0026180026|nr:hypothetical protein [uncultured Polaribacter sp.]